MPSLNITISYAVFLLLGLFIVILGAQLTKYDKKKIYVSNVATVKKEVKKRKRFDDFLDKQWLVEYSEKHMQRFVLASGYKITARQLTKARIIFFLAGLFISVVILNNFLITIPICIMFYLVPGSLVIRKAKKREILFDAQLLDSFQMFVTDFTSTKNVQTSVYNMTRKSIEPLKTEWEYLSRSLNSGIALDKCFLNFADRTGSKWSRIFAQIMISYYRQGNDFVEQLMSLTGKMNDEKIEVQENQTEISSMTTLNVVLNLAVPCVYIGNKILQPEASAAFSDTFQGRIIVLIITLCCAFSLYASKKLAEW